MDYRQRERIAKEIVRRADTVSILTREEVVEICFRAFSGEFDDMFTAEELSESHTSSNPPSSGRDSG